VLSLALGIDQLNKPNTRCASQVTRAEVLAAGALQKSAPVVYRACAAEHKQVVGRGCAADPGRVCPGTGPVHRSYNCGRGAVARAAASCCCAGACRSDIGACERTTAGNRAVLGRSPPDTENHGGTQGAPSLAQPSAQEPCCRRPWQQPQQQPRLQQHPNQGYRPGVMRSLRQSPLVCTRTTS